MDMKSYVVIGLGRFGTQIATRLYEYGKDVLVIDVEETLVDQISDHVTRAVVADAKNKDVLRGLGVSDCDCAIVALGSDLAGSILVTMNMKALGVPHVICKARDDTHREILEKLGADQVIIPERVVADKLARTMASPNILEFIELSNDYGIIEYKSPKTWENKLIKELNIRAKYGVNIIAVKKNNKVKISPSAEYTIPEESVLVLLGDYKALEQIKRIK